MYNDSHLNLSKGKGKKYLFAKILFSASFKLYDREAFYLIAKSDYTTTIPEFGLEKSTHVNYHV